MHGPLQANGLETGKTKPPGKLGRGTSPGVAVALGSLLSLGALTRVRAEDRVDYRYEDYGEDAGRIHVRTHGANLSADLKSWLSVKATYVYDAISGATPLGAPPLPGESTVAKARIDDVRQAGSIAGTVQLQNHSLTPVLSYSRENDYESVGVSLRHAVELDDKNTTLSWGLSRSFDRVLPNRGESISSTQEKGATDLFLGVTQLLDARTILNANLTLGYADGYLSDPYKRVVFDDFPHTPGLPYTVWPEHRPEHRFRQVVLFSVQHAFESVGGAIEGDYRFHHDDFDVVANTITMQWHQKLGSKVLVSPLFRYHTQTAARFYGTHFPGDPSLPGSPLPTYFSADYRLSALDSFTFGVAVTAQLHEHLSLSVAYKRYVMVGTDGVTADDQYPQANVFTGGLTLWF